jgi:hypothetical protein
MADSNSLPDDTLNPYAPPRTEAHTDSVSPAESFVRNYQGRARAIRAVATLHFFFALCLMPAVFGPIIGGIDTWSRPERALNPKMGRFEALVAFAMGIVSLIVDGFSIGVAVGLWRFRRWAGRLAMLQAFLLLALGSSMATYQLYSSGEPSSGLWLLPGVVLLLLAGFIRSRRSLVVCSYAYRKARTEFVYAGS